MCWGVWRAVAVSVDVLRIGIGCAECTDVLGCVGDCGCQC